MGADITKRQPAALIEREGSGHVSLCPELDTAGQGTTIEPLLHDDGGHRDT